MTNIVLLIDGTEQAQSGNTNVYRLSELLPNNQKQVVKYMPGIGTDGAWREKKYQAATGLGTTGKISEAYKYLCQSYSPGDSIYLFGFSRGGFGARALAGFIDAVGLLLKSVAKEKEIVDKAFEIYQSGEDASHSELRQFLLPLVGAEAPSIEHKTVLPIHFIGVWDVVASLAKFEPSHCFSAQFTEKYETTLPRVINHARHALAMHELRRPFEPLLWTGPHADRPDQTLIQAWFPGDHSDVGGGHRDHSAISDITLRWMALEAKRKGLLVATVAPPPGRGGVPYVHHYFKGPFRMLAPCVRKALVDPSYWEIARQSYYFHDSALRHFLDKRRRRYSYGPRINLSLRDVDRQAFELFLKLSMDRDRRAESWLAGIQMGSHQKKTAGIDASSPWWNRVDIDDLPDWKSIVEEEFEGQLGKPHGFDLSLAVNLWLAFDRYSALKEIKTGIRKLTASARSLMGDDLEKKKDWRQVYCDWCSVSEQCSMSWEEPLSRWLAETVLDGELCLAATTIFHTCDPPCQETVKSVEQFTSPAAPAPWPAPPPA